MSRNVSRAKAEKVLAAVAVWLGKHNGQDGPVPTGLDAANRGEGPQLVMDWESMSGSVAPTLLLEGQYEWPVYAAADEGLRAQMSAMGVFIEPRTGYALGVYPA